MSAPPQQQVPIENFGEFKMQMFKRNARQILGSAASTATEESEFVENFEYKQSSVTDIVTAYKSLKQMLYKAQGGPKPQSIVPPNAGYLKKTIAAQQ